MPGQLLHHTTLDVLFLESCWRQIESDFRPLLELIQPHQHPVADNDELFVTSYHRMSPVLSELRSLCALQNTTQSIVVERLQPLN